MREVGWEEFCALPEGAIYVIKGADNLLEGGPGLCCRDEVIQGYRPTVGGGGVGPIDFFYSTFLPKWKSLDEMVYEVDDSLSRDGLFDYDRRFLIYEPADIDIILGMLGLPPAGVIRDLLEDAEGSAAYQLGLGVATEHEACVRTHR